MRGWCDTQHIQPAVNCGLLKCQRFPLFQESCMKLILPCKTVTEWEHTIRAAGIPLKPGVVAFLRAQFFTGAICAMSGKVSTSWLSRWPWPYTVDPVAQHPASWHKVTNRKFAAICCPSTSELRHQSKEQYKGDRRYPLMTSTLTRNSHRCG